MFVVSNDSVKYVFKYVVKYHFKYSKKDTNYVKYANMLNLLVTYRTKSKYHTRCFNPAISCTLFYTINTNELIFYETIFRPITIHIRNTCITNIDISFGRSSVLSYLCMRFSRFYITSRRSRKI